MDVRSTPKADHSPALQDVRFGHFRTHALQLRCSSPRGERCRANGNVERLGVPSPKSRAADPPCVLHGPLKFLAEFDQDQGLFGPSGSRFQPSNKNTRHLGSVSRREALKEKSMAQIAIDQAARVP